MPGAARNQGANRATVPSGGSRDGPSGGVEVVRARKSVTSCYDQQCPGDGITPKRAPRTTKPERAKVGVRQVGQGAGVQVGGAHLRRQNRVPKGVGRAALGPREGEGVRGAGVWPREADARRRPAGPAPREQSRGRRRAGRPPAVTWGPARHLPLGRP